MIINSLPHNNGGRVKSSFGIFMVGGTPSILSDKNDMSRMPFKMCIRNFIGLNISSKRQLL